MANSSLTPDIRHLAPLEREPEGATPEDRLRQFANLVWATGVAEGNEVAVTVSVHQMCGDIEDVLRRLRAI